MCTERWSGLGLCQRLQHRLKTVECFRQIIAYDLGAYVHNFGYLFIAKIVIRLKIKRFPKELKLY